MERQLIAGDNDRPNPNAAQRRKLTISVAAARSKGTTGKELMSYFQALQ